jgi:hypothetical protein
VSLRNQVIRTRVVSGPARWRAVMFVSAGRCEPVAGGRWDGCGGVGFVCTSGVCHQRRSRNHPSAVCGVRSSCAPWRGCRRLPCRTTRPSGCAWRRRTPSGRRGCGWSSSAASARPDRRHDDPQQSARARRPTPATPGASDTVPPGSNRGRSPQAGRQRIQLRLDASGSGRPAFTPARSRRASRTAPPPPRSPFGRARPRRQQIAPRSQAAAHRPRTKPSAAVLEARVLMNARTSSSSPGPRCACRSLTTVHVCRSTLPSTDTRW